MFNNENKKTREMVMKVLAVLIIISFVGFAVAPAFLR